MVSIRLFSTGSVLVASRSWHCFLGVLVLFLGCEADEVVLIEANLVIGEVETVYTEVEVKGCLVRLGWNSG